MQHRLFYKGKSVYRLSLSPKRLVSRMTASHENEHTVIDHGRLVQCMSSILGPSTRGPWIDARSKSSVVCIPSACCQVRLSDTECVPGLPDGQTGDEYNFGGYVILSPSLSVWTLKMEMQIDIVRSATHKRGPVPPARRGSVVSTALYQHVLPGQRHSRACVSYTQKQTIEYWHILLWFIPILCKWQRKTFEVAACRLWNMIVIVVCFDCYWKK